eukprot:scaffold2655_cov179-Amphora_coffeaeformis.AAC.11
MDEKPAAVASASASRKRKPDEEEGDDESQSRKVAKTGAEASKQKVSYTLKDGKLRSDGKIQGATLHVQGKKSFTVKAGEAILLLKLADPDATEPTPQPALVVGYYSKDGGKMFTIRVRWLITAQELGALPTDFPWKGLDRSTVLENMTESDVVLSPQVDDLPVQSIVEKASIKLHWMYDDDTSPKHNKGISTDVPPGTYTCHYQLKLDADHALHLDYVRLETANDLEGTANLSTGQASHSSIESQSLANARGDDESSDDDGGDDEEDDEDEKRVVAEGEGSNLRDIEKALTLVEQEPTRFVTAWAQFEKDIFNDNFRRHHGTIRKIAKSVAPFKTVQEVIDYQYRFKIPDQFRLYQERKREIAVRIVECIDHRRVIDPSSETRRRPLGSTGQHWSETSATDLVRATEERREKARQLMLDVNAALGKSVLGQVANAVKELNRADTPSARANLFSLLHGHTDLQRRFNEFLPKQV